MGKCLYITQRPIQIPTKTTKETDRPTTAPIIVVNTLKKVNLEASTELRLNAKYTMVCTRFIAKVNPKHSATFPQKRNNRLVPIVNAKDRENL